VEAKSVNNGFVVAIAGYDVVAMEDGAVDSCYGLGYEN